MRQGLILQHVLISTNKSVLWSPRREEVLAYSAQLFMGRPAECAGGSLSARETLAGRCGLSAERRHRITTHFLSCYLPAFCLFAECEIYTCLQIRSAFHTLPPLFVLFFIHHPPPLLLLFLLCLCKLFTRCQKPVRMFWNISD